MRREDRIHIVVLTGPEDYILGGVYLNYWNALERWFELKSNLKEDYEEEREWNEGSDFGCGDMYQDMYQGMIEDLECNDPEEINCYPHLTPTLETIEVNTKLEVWFEKD